MQRYMTYVFNLAYSGKVDTWDFQLHFSLLFQNGLSIVPEVNLVSNIGTSGTHTGQANNKKNKALFFPVFPLDTEKLSHPKHIFPNLIYEKHFFSKNFRRLFLKRVKGKLISEIRKIFT